MKRNVGKIDRALRVIAGLAIIAAGLYYDSWWGAVGALLIATAVIRWCPPYQLLGIDTAGTK